MVHPKKFLYGRFLNKDQGMTFIKTVYTDPIRSLGLFRKFRFFSFLLYLIIIIYKDKKYPMVGLKKKIQAYV